MFLPFVLSLGLTLGASANNSCEAAFAVARNALAECNTAMAVFEKALAESETATVVSVKALEGCTVTGDPYSTDCKLAEEKLAAATDACNLAREKSAAATDACNLAQKKVAAAEDACYSLPSEEIANISNPFRI